MLVFCVLLSVADSAESAIIAKRFMSKKIHLTLPVSAQPRPRRSDNQEPLKYATIGVSGYAGILLDCLEPLIEQDQAKLIAATVRTRSKSVDRCDQIEKRGGRIFRNWQEMLGEMGKDIDCLIIPTGIQDHCKMAVYALKCGINVLLEKPIAATLGEAHAILEAAERSEAGLIIGYQDIYTESTHAIKALLQKGTIGNIQSINIVCLWPRGDDYFARNNWAGRLRIGDDWVLDSPVNNAMGHFINLPLFWLGETPLESAAVSKLRGSLYRTRDLESFDTASIQIDTAQGSAIYFHGSHACDNFFGPEIRIVGSEGEIHWICDQHYIVKTKEGDEAVPMLSAMDARRLLMKTTADWLMGEAVHVSTAEQALQQTRVIHLLHSGLKIQTVCEKHITTSKDKRVLSDLEATFKQCFKVSRLLSPDDAPWAKNPQEIEWKDVSHLSEPVS